MFCEHSTPFLTDCYYLLNLLLAEKTHHKLNREIFLCFFQRSVAYSFQNVCETITKFEMIYRL